jgi:hypothetical protein
MVVTGSVQMAMRSMLVLPCVHQVLCLTGHADMLCEVEQRDGLTLVDLDWCRSNVGELESYLRSVVQAGLHQGLHA